MRLGINPELWEKGKAVFSKTCLWNEVKEDPAYLNISKDDDLILSKCHARISGNLAKNVLEKIARKDGEKNIRLEQCRKGILPC